jgi:hypothetical protein
LITKLLRNSWDTFLDVQQDSSNEVKIPPHPNIPTNFSNR